MTEVQPLDRETQRKWLRGVFPGLHEPLLSETVARLELVHVPAGQLVVRQGDAAHALYIVVRGSVSVVREDRAGSHSTVATLGPGQVVGEMALMAGAPRNATISAITDLDLLKLDREGLRRIVEDPSLHGKPAAASTGRPELPERVQAIWTQAVRSACHALVASHHVVQTIDVLGRPATADGPAMLLQLTDLARRIAAEYGIQVRVSHIGHRPVVHLTIAESD